MKVYCDNCKYLNSNITCLHPKNMKKIDRWSAPTIQTIHFACNINENNDCKWWKFWIRP